ncbi:MAG: hypothetical protein A2Y40_06580 [Candidatus Margulisbacteria bacterium GWF2_35_9]|nr:MAG: hypothetical protein A2Y40_06580 [Candidatus Margulisbacteria bacterium GWF2_35_9]
MQIYPVESVDQNNDTIAAISTPSGIGGIGIIRISGNKSYSILNKIFVNNKKEHIYIDNERMVFHGWIIDTNSEFIDEVLCFYMKAPRSYTGEDMVEIQCHGGNISCKQILSITIQQGCRLAEKGEFIYRAYQNKKVTLDKVEATLQLINADNNIEYFSAVDVMSGKYAKFIENIFINVADYTMNIRLYPDNFLEKNNIIQMIINEINMELKKYDDICYLRNGYTIPIVGKTNVGKSQLFNLLIGEEKAIVCDESGTTRDPVETKIYDLNYNIQYKLIDTAGITQSVSKAEKLAIKKTKELIRNSPMVIFLTNHLELDNIEKDIIKLSQNHMGVSFKKEVAEKHVYQFVSKNNLNTIEYLKNKIALIIEQQMNSYQTSIIINERQRKGFVKLNKSLTHLLNNNIPNIALKDCKHTINIINDIKTIENIQDVTKQFCVGK